MEELNHQMTEDPIVKEPIEKQARIWGMLCHLTALIVLLRLPSYTVNIPFINVIVNVSIPFVNVIGPLVVWLFKRKSSPFVDAQGKESLNFQLSMTFYIIIAALMLSVIYIKLGIFPMLPIVVLAIINLLLVVIATVRANSGDIYRYPFTIRLIK
jgi:uncharacterized protein